MKLFILTHCAAEENYTPLVFKTKEEAKKEMNQIADKCIYERDTDGEIVGQYADYFRICENRAEIDYSDETYDVLQIFEIEVEI